MFNFNWYMNLPKLNLKIKKLTNTAQLPTHGSLYAAGLDLYADIPSNHESNPLIIEPHQTILIHTGLAMAIPSGFFGAIYARSGLASKQSLRPANCVGIIDADYTGEVMVALHNDSDNPQAIIHNQRIAQLILQPVFDTTIIEVDNLATTDRGEGGFGSSGR